MGDIPVTVRAGTQGDLARVLGLLDQARRQYLTFGEEDLKRLLNSEPFMLAVTGPLLWGFCVCATDVPPWASLRGVALLNGWKTETGMRTLMTDMHVVLRGRNIRYAYCLSHESWLPPALLGLGYRVDERIITFERSPGTLPDLAVKGLHLRPAGPTDLATIQAIDQAAFTPPWIYARRELIYLLLTSSHSVIAELNGQPVGYTCSDVKNGTGQIIRVAVTPAVQGQGVGQQMLVDAINFCTAKGVERMSLNTQASNTISQHLYQSSGFRRSGRSVPVLAKEI